jgi:hypothetical protein
MADFSHSLGPSRHFAAARQLGRFRSEAEIKGQVGSASLVANDPMYGPAVRCKRFRRSGRYGLASMYPASAWSGLCSGPSWDQRACDLISGQAPSIDMISFFGSFCARPPAWRAKNCADCKSQYRGRAGWRSLPGRALSPLQNKQSWVITPNV